MQTQHTQKHYVVVIAEFLDLVSLLTINYPACTSVCASFIAVLNRFSSKICYTNK